MPRANLRRPLDAGRRVVLILGILAPGTLAHADGSDRRPPTAAIQGSLELGRATLPPRTEAGRRTGAGDRGAGGWWLGTVGVAVALAVFGAVSVASRKYLPQQASGPLRVVGRTSLSPKHTVYLLRAGDRVLIVGTGPQGAPSLLGELPDAGGAGPEMPSQPMRPTPVAPDPAPGTITVRFDRRVGDDA